MLNARALQRVRKRNASNLAIGYVRPVEQRAYHRVLEMSAAPPRHQPRRITFPSFRLEIGLSRAGEPGLHVHHGAVQVEHANRDFALDGFHHAHESFSITNIELPAL